MALVGLRLTAVAQAVSVVLAGVAAVLALVHQKPGHVAVVLAQKCALLMVLRCRQSAWKSPSVPSSAGSRDGT